MDVEFMRNIYSIGYTELFLPLITILQSNPFIILADFVAIVNQTSYDNYEFGNFF